MLESDFALQAINNAEQICGVIVEWTSCVSTVSGCFSKEFLEFRDIPQFLDSAIYCHSKQREMGCFVERALWAPSRLS